jgi:hypothetical protein
LGQKRQFFADFLAKIFLKNHNIGPWSHWLTHSHGGAGLFEAHGVLRELGGARLLDHAEEVVGAAGHILALLKASPEKKFAFELFGPPFFPFSLFVSTTLSIGMTSIFLHMQWPLTSQSHGGILKEHKCFYLLRLKLHETISFYILNAFEPIKRQCFHKKWVGLHFGQVFHSHSKRVFKTVICGHRKVCAWPTVAPSSVDA